MIAMAAGVLNFVLDPLLMFTFGLGIHGAALATVIAQFAAAMMACAYLLDALHQQANQGAGVAQKSIGSYLKFYDTKSLVPTMRKVSQAAGAMLIRTMSILIYWATATALATRLGTCAVAAHHVCLSVWLFLILPVEAPSVAGQVLVSRRMANVPKDLSTEDASTVQVLVRDAKAEALRVIRRVVGISVAAGAGVGALLLALTPAIPFIFSVDQAVNANLQRIIPVAALLMPLVSFCMSMEGVLTGLKEFKYMALSTLGVTASFTSLIIFMSQMSNFNILSIWWVIGGLFVARSTSATLKVARIFRGLPPFTWPMRLRSRETKKTTLVAD